MAEIDNFDSAQARVWKQKVDSEIQEIELLLNQVRQVTANPTPDDTIMKAIQAIGENEEKIWSNVKRTFAEVSDKTQEVISSFEKFGEGAIERVSQILARRG